MYEPNNNKRGRELERLFNTLTFDDILEESDLTKHEVIEILYDSGHLKVPPYLEDVETDDENN